jgi:ariadne-1
MLMQVEPALAEKYAQQNVEYFVRDNPRIKFCPGPDCSLAAEIRDVTPAPVCVRCHCSHVWCFSCGGAPHFPLPCVFARRWREKTADDGEMATVEYIKATTKICPWCGEGVYRTDGCNFMTCKCGENW